MGLVIMLLREVSTSMATTVIPCGCKVLSGYQTPLREHILCLCSCWRFDFEAC